ncbi:MAG: glycosyltransferase [Myxococcota bacterium]
MRHDATTAGGSHGRPLRVAHLVQYFEVGGIERMVHALATHAQGTGVVHEVLAYVADGDFRAALEADGVETRFFPSGPGLHPTLPLRIARHLRTRHVDVLHSHHLGPFLYGAVASRLTCTPQVHTEHSVELYDTPRRRVLGRIMPRVARVVSVAPEIARWRRAHFGDDSPSIPNGIPAPPLPDEAARRRAREDLGLPADAFVIGCVARLSPEKGHRHLVDAFARVAEALPNARLVLVGDGAERSRVETQARDLGVADRVDLLGQRFDVPDLIPAFDVMALASVREGLPLALLEGMAQARPIVATAVGGVGGLLDLAGGRAVPAADPDAMAEALLGYARDPEQRRRDGEAGRDLVLERYSMDAMARAYEGLYRAATGRNAP